ncbi:ferrous iron transport protein A [Candidatus Latescibacterota bacterium]
MNIKNTIKDLAPGMTGVISKIKTPSDIKRRLMDMGIITGAKVEMVRSAPLGDPVEIKVQNTLIALRKSEAGLIYIEKGKKHNERKQHRHRSGRKSE